MKYAPRPYQDEAEQSIWNYFRIKTGNPLVAMPTGCHAKDHLILMFDGSFKKVQDIVIGDLLMGPDSNPREVLQLARGRQEMRRIVPNKGNSFVVNKDHKMLLKVLLDGNGNKLYPTRDKIITISEYENHSNWYRSYHRFQYCPVKFAQTLQPLPPYFIGLMLGDGSMCNGVFSLTSADKEIIDYSSELFEIYGLIPRINKEDKSSKAFVVTATDPECGRGKGSTGNRITNIFKRLGIQEKRAWQKSIPDIYKICSRDQQLEILAGLIDTDGHYQLNANCFEYCTTSPQLAKDVSFIIKSLGFKGQINKESSYYKNKEGVRIECRDSYRIHITGDINLIPTKLARKQAREPKAKRNCLLMNFTIEKLPEDDFYGFELSGDHLYLDSDFIIHHNTGKSVVIALFLQNVFKVFPNQKILVATHVKKLIEQNYHKLKTNWPEAPAGIFSAGLNQKDYYSRIIFCGIASIVKNVIGFGKIDLMIIDEADLVSQDEESMYLFTISELKKVNPHLKVIGLTATAWRTGQGDITNEGLFTDICCDMTTMERFNQFFDEGWLCPLVPLRTDITLDVTGVHKVAGDYNKNELQEAVMKGDITTKALAEAVKYGHNRHSWLIFAAGVKHCEIVAEILNTMGINCVVAHSKMNSKECDKNINDWIEGKVTAIVNNGMLTTGIDNPACDLIVILRPTMSSRLWVQMLGRGTRPYYLPGAPLLSIEDRLFAIKHSQKPNCLVLDFAANAKRLGPINDPVIPKQKGKGSPGDAPIRICPSCNMYNHASARWCGGQPQRLEDGSPNPKFDIMRGCGREFLSEPKISQKASSEALIKRKELPITEWFNVDSVTYQVHSKTGKPDCLRVSYFTTYHKFQEFVHFDSPVVSLLMKAKNWWKLRCKGDLPMSTAHAIKMSDQLVGPKKILVWINTQFPEIMKVSFVSDDFEPAPRTELQDDIPF